MLSRSELAVRLLGLSRLSEPTDDPGVVLVQIAGLSFAQLNKSARQRCLPFVKNLLKQQDYQLHGLYSGLPANTAAVQAELFYGVKGSVSAFNNLEQFEAGLKERGGPGLLRGGSSYGNVFTGGAKEPHFCQAQGRKSSLWPAKNILLRFLLAILYLDIFIRALFALMTEWTVALFELFRGTLKGENSVKELKSVGPRVFADSLLRERMVAGACWDIARGVPIIHVNFGGYDKQAQKRGVNSSSACRSLRAIDNAIRRIHNAIRQSPCREYDLWVYGDHGQESTEINCKESGHTLEKAVEQLFQSTNTPKFLWAMVMGPLGHIYVNETPAKQELQFYAPKLVSQLKVPLVLVREEPGKVIAWTSRGVFILPDQMAEVFGADHPFLEEMKHDLVRMCYHPNAGEWILAHAGMSKEETMSFALVPKSIQLEVHGKSYLRPIDLREAVLQFMDKKSYIDFVEFEVHSGSLLPWVNLQFF